MTLRDRVLSALDDDSWASGSGSLDCEAALRFLAELRGAFSPHTGATLFQHLVGTFQILRRWECHEDICLAGLFHSIYGTDSNDSETLSTRHRAQLRNIIGERAEWLVFAFHATRWGVALTSEESVADMSPAIRIIAAANFLEQVDRLKPIVGKAALRDSSADFVRLIPYLSKSAATELSRHLQEFGILS